MALQVLYQLEQNSGAVTPDVRQFVERRVLGESELVLYTIGLVEGVQGHQPEIDETIARLAENWRLDRMAAIDRNIIRIGAFEILHGRDVPAKVAINEALKLAKRYSTAQSSRFVNGILDKVLQTAESAGTDVEGDVDPEPSVAPDPDPEAEPSVEEGPAA